jgi:hypothetical protein
MATRTRRPHQFGERPETNEAVSLWFALGLPMVTFSFWLTGLLFLHPWIGFFGGLVLAFAIGVRLTKSKNVAP